MTSAMPTLTAGPLVLEPLDVRHADAMFAVLSDAALYRHLDFGPPVSPEALRERYARLTARTSPDGTQGWLNWIVCRREEPGSVRPIGFVQATVVRRGTARVAWVAYLIGTADQSLGLARIATGRMIDHLVQDEGIDFFLATVEADHRASIALLQALGFRAATADDHPGTTLTSTERSFVRRSPRPDSNGRSPT